MRILAFTFKISGEPLEIAKKWLGLTGIEDIKVYNIPQFKPEEIINSLDVVITFGHIAHQLIVQAFENKNLSPWKIIQLPLVKDLAPIPSNKEARATTKETLENLTETLKKRNLDTEKIVLFSEDIKELDEYQLTSLKKAIDTGIIPRDIILTTSSGKQICISEEGQSETSVITYQELLAIYRATKIFEVDKIEIVEKEK